MNDNFLYFLIGTSLALGMFSILGVDFGVFREKSFDDTTSLNSLSPGVGIQLCTEGTTTQLIYCDTNKPQSSAGVELYNYNQSNYKQLQDFLNNCENPKIRTSGRCIGNIINILKVDNKFAVGIHNDINNSS